MAKGLISNVILSHPTGNAFVRAILTSLFEQKMLDEFHTSIATFPNNIFGLLGKFKLFKELNRRDFNPNLQPLTTTRPFREMGRLLSHKLGLNKLTSHEDGFFSVDQVYRSLDKNVANSLKSSNSQNIDAVYAYEDGAFETFTQAKKLGLTCIYDLPIAYWETGKYLMLEEAARLPSWAVTLGGGIKDSETKHQRKSDELELADIVVVPSKFVLDSLPNWASHKRIIVSAFGSPISRIKLENKLNAAKDHSRPLRLLFVGSMSQRKGLGDLFAAMKLLKGTNIELVVMGSMLNSMSFYRNQYSDFTYEHGRPHHQVLELMQTCDVFCLPSIVEGRALVMQEAMSQGLPIIITPNTGGEDLVIEGKTGFLVPIRSPEKIAEKINWFLENRQMIAEMGKYAQQHAATYTWNEYGNRIIQGFKEHIHDI